MNKLKVNTGIWFVFVVASFWLLGQFSISVGDDLGYMFTDSALHKGDGKLSQAYGNVLQLKRNIILALMVVSSFIQQRISLRQ